tara:strand:- start:26 stop:466 length:441 start_codon:yes stop_codon:yes gene_type:complete
MKKKFLAMMTAAIISAPALFAFHEEDTGHLIAGMPVVFMATGVKFTPQQHSELRAIAQTWFASECFLSQRMSMDLLVDAEGKGTLVMRWPTKESYIRDQKAILDPNHPAGICDAIAKFRMNTVKLSGVKPSDVKFTTFTSIASSPR